MKLKSKCKECGKKYIVDTNSRRTCRTDRKRIYPKGDKTPGLCCFRCSCGALIHDTVRFAKFPSQKRRSK